MKNKKMINFILFIPITFIFISCSDNNTPDSYYSYYESGDSCDFETDEGFFIDTINWNDYAFEMDNEVNLNIPLTEKWIVQKAYVDISDQIFHSGLQSLSFAPYDMCASIVEVQYSYKESGTMSFWVYVPTNPDSTYYFQIQIDNELKLQIQTDMNHNLWQQYTLDLPAGIHRIEFIGPFDYLGWIYLDDIEFY